MSSKRKVSRDDTSKSNLGRDKTLHSKSQERSRLSWLRRGLNWVLHQLPHSFWERVDSFFSTHNPKRDSPLAQTEPLEDHALRAQVTEAQVTEAQAVIGATKKDAASASADELTAQSTSEHRDVRDDLESPRDLSGDLTQDLTREEEEEHDPALIDFLLNEVSESRVHELSVYNTTSDNDGLHEVHASIFEGLERGDEQLITDLESASDDRDLNLADHADRDYVESIEHVTSSPESAESTREVEPIPESARVTLEGTSPHDKRRSSIPNIKLQNSKEERARQRRERRRERRRKRRLRSAKRELDRKAELAYQRAAEITSESSSDLSSLESFERVAEETLGSGYALRPSASGHYGAPTTRSRPPLRDLVPLRVGFDPKFNASQVGAHSLHSELFGSWLGSLESLLELQESAIRDREYFVEMVAAHGDLKDLSESELDAWWFQLNRANQFVDEYYLLRETQETQSTQ